MLAAWHTWTQRLVFHLDYRLGHGGGLSEPALAKAADGAAWHPAGKTFLFPKSALATRARAAPAMPRAEAPPGLLTCRPMSGRSPGSSHDAMAAALDYLARYAFRIAITNNRILAVDDATVTYRYKDRAADRQRKESRPAGRAGGSAG